MHDSQIEERAGGVSSFENLARHYNDLLFRMARANTGNDADAEDLTQEVLLRWWQGWQNNPNAILNVQSWFRPVSYRKFVDMIRSRYFRDSATVSLDPIGADGGLLPAAEVTPLRALEAQDTLLALSNHLDQEERELLIHGISRFSGDSLEDIASRIGINAPALSMRFTRLWDKLRDLVKQGVVSKDAVCLGLALVACTVWKSAASGAPIASVAEPGAGSASQDASTPADSGWLRGLGWLRSPLPAWMSALLLLLLLVLALRRDPGTSPGTDTDQPADGVSTSFTDPGFLPVATEMREAERVLLEDLLRQDKAPDEQLRVARAGLLLADDYTRSGNYPKADATYDRADRAITEVLKKSEDDPEKIRLRYVIFQNWAGLKRWRNEEQEAKNKFNAAIAQAERLIKLKPDNPEYLNDKARSFHGLGTLARDKKNYAEAENAFRQAIAIRKELVRREQESLEGQAATLIPADRQKRERLLRRIRHELGGSYRFLSLTLKTKQPPEMAAALAAVKEAVKLQVEVTQEEPFQLTYLQEAGAAYGGLAALVKEDGDSLQKTGKLEEARRLHSDARLYYLKAIDYQEEVIQAFGGPLHHCSLAITLGNLGRLDVAEDHPSNAVKHLERALKYHQLGIRTALSPESDSRKAFRNDFLFYLKVLLDQGDRPTAEKLTSFPRSNPTTAADCQWYAGTLAQSHSILAASALPEDDRAAMTKKFQDRAMALLTRGASLPGGLRSRELSADPALAPLRHREDFKRLLKQTDDNE